MVSKIGDFNCFNLISKHSKDIAVTIATTLLLSSTIFTISFGLTFIPKITKSISLLSSKLHVNKIFIQLFVPTITALSSGGVVGLSCVLFKVLKRKEADSNNQIKEVILKEDDSNSSQIEKSVFINDITMFSKSITDDVIYIIIEYVVFGKDFLNLMLVSKNFYNIANSIIVWRNFLIREVKKEEPSKEIIESYKKMNDTTEIKKELKKILTVVIRGVSDLKNVNKATREIHWIVNKKVFTATFKSKVEEKLNNLKFLRSVFLFEYYTFRNNTFLESESFKKLSTLGISILRLDTSPSMDLNFHYLSYEKLLENLENLYVYPIIERPFDTLFSYEPMHEASEIIKVIIYNIKNTPKIKKIFFGFFEKDFQRIYTTIEEDKFIESIGNECFNIKITKKQNGTINLKIGSKTLEIILFTFKVDTTDPNKYKYHFEFLNGKTKMNFL